MLNWFVRVSHLRLEAEDGHGDEDDRGDPQRQEHRLGVIVTGVLKDPKDKR